MLIGDFIGKTCVDTTPDNVLIETLKEELETIIGYEVKEVETDTEINEGEKKIYLQRYIHTGHYHLFRQDSDNKWSHKYPNELPTRRDSIGRIIESIDLIMDKAFTGWCFLLRKKES